MGGGELAGLMAAGLLMFYPEYLGHSRFVTLDVPTLVFVAAISLLFFASLIVMA